ncbi:MAG: hypothetical protein AAB652_00740 [Patescibacteria group bacterium]
METRNLDWQRIERAIKQEARRYNTENKVGWALEATKRVIDFSGPASSSRAMCVRIGKILLGDTQTIIVPSCPMHYAYENDRFAFAGVNPGVSFLTEKHIEFLKKITGVLPEAKPIILIPDQEANDPDLLGAMKISAEELAEVMYKSIEATKNAVEPLGWQAKAMTEAVPDLSEREKQAAEWIRESEEFTLRINNDTIARQAMYYALASAGRRAGMPVEEMVHRTIRTAAQYVAIGRYTAEKGYLVVSHTTTNLMWYFQTDAAVLHNPVSIYQ